ncbi:MAG: glycosyltransferase [Clostridiales bacterium]|jgi:glycosyltransferase involved in cell wall biosynthesis|nr:glycosyltransferase [Clostridiales bacterium]
MQNIISLLDNIDFKALGTQECLNLRAEVRDNIHNILTEVKPTRDYDDYIRFCYKLWRLFNEPTKAELDFQKSAVFEINPKISIIVPVYNVKTKLLRLLLDSVCAQTYANWELCIADGGSANEEIRRVILEYAKHCDKIKYVFLNENKGIAENSNAAIMISSGDYLAFVDHDDTLTPDAMYETVKAINENKNAGLIYTDNDWSDADENRFNPVFKPDWSPYTFLMSNYIIHLVIVKRKLAFTAGLFEKKYDLYQDTALTFKVSEIAEKIVHIPKVLYNWRNHEASVSHKDRTQDDFHKELINLTLEVKYAYLERMGRCMDSQSLVSVVIRVSEDIISLRKTIMSVIGKAKYKKFEVIILYSSYNSDEVKKHCEQLRKNPLFKVFICDTALNMLPDAIYYNTAAKKCTGKYIFFVNKGVTIAYERWLEAWVAVLCNFKNIAVGGGTAEITDSSGKRIYQTAEEYVGNNTDIKDFAVPVVDLGIHFFAHSNVEYGVHNVSSVSKGLVAVNRNIFNELGGFDTDFPDTFYLTDLCLRCRDIGWQNIIYRRAKVTLSGAENVEMEDIEAFVKELDVFEKKWGKHLKAPDPFLNPNLSLINLEKYGCPYRI